MSDEKILIASPCYNCAKQVVRVFDALEKEREAINFQSIFIDNRSTDNTVDVLKTKIESSPNASSYSLLLNDENYGLGGTHKVAFKYAKDNGFDLVIILHGDDQASAKDIKLLIQEFRLKKHSVLGSRFKKGSVREGYQWSRVFGNCVLNIIFSIFLRKNINDLGSGLNLFYVKDLSAISLVELSDRFNFNVDLLLALIKNKVNFSYYPILWRESDQVSNARNVTVALSMLKSLYLYLLSLKKDEQMRDYSFKIVL